MIKKNLPPTLAIIGFGNQALTWALNLRDEKYPFVIGVRELHNFATEKATAYQLPITQIDALWFKYQFYVLLIPDDQHVAFLTQFQSHIPPQATIIYAHGYSVTAENLIQKFPQWEHCLLAPKCIASEMRKQYLSQGILTAIIHCLNPEIKPILLKIAAAIGINWGPFPANFEEECFADLFSEQTTLCHFAPYFTNQCFAFLVQKGVPKELAFAETFLELKLIIDALVSMGPQKFFENISPNALIGSWAQFQQQKDRFKLDEYFEEVWQQITEKKFFSTLKKTSYLNVKKDISQFWQQQELQKTYQQFAKLSNAKDKGEL